MLWETSSVRYWESTFTCIVIITLHQSFYFKNFLKTKQLQLWYYPHTSQMYSSSLAVVKSKQAGWNGRLVTKYRTPGKGHSPSFDHYNKGSYVLSLVEIGPVVLEKKISKFIHCIFAVSLSSLHTVSAYWHSILTLHNDIACWQSILTLHTDSPY